MNAQYGEIMKPNTLVLREHLGTATAKIAGQKYNFELGRTLPGAAPIVRCVETGKDFLLSWEDILNLAEDAGIATPKEETE